VFRFSVVWLDLNQNKQVLVKRQRFHFNFFGCLIGLRVIFFEDLEIGRQLNLKPKIILKLSKMKICAIFISAINSVICEHFREFPQIFPTVFYSKDYFDNLALLC
jgi:hypothetical protein